MSRVRKYQGGTKVESGPAKDPTPKYKILIDGRELEFTDEELDQAWSNTALKNILKEGGIREDDLNARYSQFKDQVKAGTYNFDVAPSLTLEGTYEGGSANLGSDKRIRAIDKIFGVKNEGKQMSTVNYYLPMLLKQVALDRDASAKTELDRLAAENKNKFGLDTEKKYAAIAQGHGFGALAYGSDYLNALNEPEKLKQILNLGYWSKDEAGRRDILTKSGAGLKEIYEMTPEELEYVETKHPGFSKKRDRILKYYDPTQNQFNFSNLPTFQDLYEYSNALDAMEQDRYLFDQNLLKSKEDLEKEKTESDQNIVTLPDDVDGGVPVGTEPIQQGEDSYTQILNQRMAINIDDSNIANNSLLKTLFPKYKPNNDYFIAWHTKGGTGTNTDKYWVPEVDADGDIIVDENGNPKLELVTYNWKTKQIILREKMSRNDVVKKYPRGFVKDTWPKEDIGHRLINIDKGLIGADQSGLTFDEPTSQIMLDGGVLKAEGGMVFKYRDDNDKLTYLQKILSEKQVDLPTAQTYYNTWVSTGKIIPTQVQEQEYIAAPEYGKLKTSLNEWHSQNLKNIRGWESLSDVDKADLGALIGDIGAIALPGPVGLVSGILGGISGLYADVQRDGLDWGDVRTAAASIGLSALALIPGLGAAKLPLIAKTLTRIVKSKTAMPVIRTALTGMGAYGALQILDKGISQGFDNLTLEDMRLLGTSIMGLKGAHTTTKKLGAYSRQAMGESKVLPVEIKTPTGLVKQRVVLSGDDMAKIRGGAEGKTSQQIAQEIVHAKILKDTNLSKLVGEVKLTDITIPTKTSYGIKGVWSPKARIQNIKTEDVGYTIDAPIELKDTKLQLVKRFLYTGDPNKALFKARELPTRGEQTIYNADATRQRIGKTEEGKFIKEGSVNEINAKSKIELSTAKEVNEKSVDELINLPKIQNELVKKLQLLRTSGVKEFPADKKSSVEKVLKSLDDNLEKAKKASKDLEPNADPDMKRNLKDLIKNQEDKLLQLKKGISYKTKKEIPSLSGENKTKALPRGKETKLLTGKETKLLPKLNRMLLLKKYLEDYAAGKTTEGKSPLSMERRQLRPKSETPKALNEPFKMKPTGLDKPKKGRKKKLADGGILLLQGGLKWWSPERYKPLSLTPERISTEEKWLNSLDLPEFDPNNLGQFKEDYPLLFPKPKLNLTGYTKWQPERKSLETTAKELLGINNITLNTSNETKETTNPTYQASGKTSFRLPTGNMDPIWSLKGAELLNSMIATKNQDTSVNAPIAQHMLEYMPTISGSGSLKQNYSNIANTQRTLANLPQTADAGVNLLQRAQIEAKLRDFELEGKLKGLMLRQQGQEKRDALTTTYNQGRQQVANMNAAANAEKLNLTRRGENEVKQISSDLLSEFMLNKAQTMQVEKEQNAAYQDKLSELQITEDIESNPDVKKNLDEWIRLTNLAQTNNGVLSALDKIKYDKLTAWRNLLKNAQLKTLYSGKVAGKPYEAGTFQFNQSI